MTTTKKKDQQLAPQAKKLPPVERTAEGLRDALFDELNLLRSGEATTGHARALAQIARLILESAKLEVRHLENISKAGKSLLLGKGK